MDQTLVSWGELACARTQASRRTWLVGALVVLLLAASGLAANASTARATRQAWTYCGYVIDPWPVYCEAVNAHTFDLNRATYPGSGDLTVCEGAILASSGSFYGPQRCGNKYAGSGYDFQGDSALKYGYVHHWGANPHTVDGAMWTGWF